MFLCYLMLLFFFFFKQKTAYEMRISDWSSDVCSYDLQELRPFLGEMGDRRNQITITFRRIRRARREHRLVDTDRMIGGHCVALFLPGDDVATHAGVNAHSGFEPLACDHEAPAIRLTHESIIDLRSFDRTVAKTPAGGLARIQIDTQTA